MRLLKRNAESLFWLARYLERGASMARVIEMQSSFGGHDSEAGWSWLLALHNDEARFKERYDVSSDNIVAFYVTDMANMGSVRSSIHWARENARALRPFVPLEMWVQINAFHALIEHIGAEQTVPAELPRTCAQIRAGCLAQIGIAEGTLYRDEGYQFFRLGLLIERADQTSRLLDVKFAQNATKGASSDASSEFVFWSTILRTAAAYQVFNRQEQNHPDPVQVARFLLLNPSHPRSIGYCTREITNALHDLRAAFHLTQTSKCLEKCEDLTTGLVISGNDKDLPLRLHEINDWVQRSLNSLTESISDAFFKTDPPITTGASKPLPSTAATQTQEQKQG